MKRCFNIFRRAAVLVSVIIFFVCGTCSAEDLKFIDANGDTGYYVDMESVKFEDSESFFVKMIVIKADLNKMYVYDLRINHALQKYVIQSTKTLAYDTRTELTANNEPRYPRPYSEKSEMNEIVNFILNGGDLQ